MMHMAKNSGEEEVERHTESIAHSLKRESESSGGLLQDFGGKSSNMPGKEQVELQS